MRLGRRALDQLLQGRHAHKGGRTLAQLWAASPERGVEMTAVAGFDAD